MLKNQKKMSITKKFIEEVVTELVGEEALPIIFYLRGKSNSEFKYNDYK